MPTELPLRKKISSTRADVNISALKWFVIAGTLILAVFLVQVASDVYWAQSDDLSANSTYDLRAP